MDLGRDVEGKQRVSAEAWVSTRTSGRGCRAMRKGAVENG